MLAIIIINVMVYRSSLITRFPIDILIAISLIPFAGFVFGFFCAWAAREPPRSRRTIMLETGLKNAQICLAIMIVTFPSEKVGVLMMMPIYFLFFQVNIFFILYIKNFIVSDQNKWKASNYIKLCAKIDYWIINFFDAMKMRNKKDSL